MHYSCRPSLGDCAAIRAEIRYAARQRLRQSCKPQHPNDFDEARDCSSCLETQCPLYRSAITNAVTLFAEHPEQWDLLRADRSLIPHAINQSLRLESPVPQFSRVLTEDHEIDAVSRPVGSRVALLYGSTNRDERHYPDPARFDITHCPRTIWPSGAASTSASECISPDWR